MADTITITGINGIGHHGVFAHERENGQPFIVDVVLALDTSLDVLVMLVLVLLLEQALESLHPIFLQVQALALPLLQLGSLLLQAQEKTKVAN